MNPHSTPTEPPSPPGRWSKPSVIVEDILIMLSIGALWFTILNKTGPVYFALQLLALAAMVVVFIRRTRRFRNSAERQD